MMRCSIRQILPASTILFVSMSNSLMESEIKIVSIASPSCLSRFLLPGSIEIHIVLRGNKHDYRVVLFHLTDALTSVGFPLLFKLFSLGYFNVFLDYLKHFWTVVSSIRMKIICGSLYYEVVSSFNIYILYFIVFMLLLFILLLSIPRGVIFAGLWQEKRNIFTLYFLKEFLYPLKIRVSHLQMSLLCIKLG